MRSIVYRFEELSAFRRLLRAGGGGGARELDLPGDEHVGDGEWVLAIFEIGAGRRATAAAARGIGRGPGQVTIAFERRDWDRLCAFAEESRAPPPSSSSLPSADDTAPHSYDPSAFDRIAMPALSTPSPSSRLRRERDHGPVSLSASGHHVAAVGARVLLVDDDESTLEMVSAMLEAVGLLVTSAATAEDALRIVRDEPVNLVVLDWSLPQMSGLELCRELRNDPDLAWVPVVFLTANTSQKDLVEAFASGADDYVLKPFRAPELGARLFSVLRRSRQSRPPSPPAPPAPPTSRRPA